MSGPGAFPGGNFPGGNNGPVQGGYPPISWYPNPGGIPWYNVGYPRFPGNPYPPIVLNPTPSPGTQPGNPAPNPNPGSTPTIPVVLPGQEVPGEHSLDYWSPWPLPPRGTLPTAATFPAELREHRTASGDRAPQALKRLPRGRQLRFTSLGSGEGRQFDLFEDNGEDNSSFENNSSASETSLKFHGGKTIRDLFYVNLYVSGDTRWSRTDVEQIDSRLSAAMRDEHLNNVLLQYFENQPIRSTALPSHPLVGYTPNTVTRGDIQNMIGWLHHRGFLRSFDLQNTVFNLLLPSGTVLTVDDRISIAVSNEVTDSVPGQSGNTVPAFEDGDSRTGLAGYHGSVATANDDRVYYSVSVYSERGANETTNGIPVFRESWKNVVATLYHQLIESRTNPDVEEAMRKASDEDAKQYLGWVTDSGLELGDLPVRSDIPLGSVFREIPLANGSGVVPVQLPWSNAVRGPEGPISQPHSLP